MSVINEYTARAQRPFSTGATTGDALCVVTVSMWTCGCQHKGRGTVKSRKIDLCGYEMIKTLQLGISALFYIV